MKLLTPENLFEYQKKAVIHQCSRPWSMLWLDMGLGKTSITLTSLAHLLSQGFLRGVLIVAPIRVIRLVWRQEAEKWEHTKHLRFSVVAGTRDQRTRALLRDADVYLINYENMQWLSETLQTYFISKSRQLPFNGLVWDEISKCKNSTTNRVKAVKKILNHFDWITGLTGTPASNGYKDLHGQFLVVDKGERLGTSKTAFKTRYYKKVGPYKEVAYQDTEETIKNLIGDITLEMSAEDYNPLPDLIINNVEIEMPEELRAQYDRMEDEFFLQLESGITLEVFNQAALTNKCLQFSNGAIYPVAGMPMWEPLHDLKLDALEEIIDEAQGNPILCSYAYRSDAERIMTRFKALDPINLTECKSEHSLNTAMHRWKTGDCQLMIGHPACLHPETQVLTERAGWVRIIDVESDDRVFDGIEFVNHSGCHYSGYKDVITVFGVTMTPDHKLLIDNEWVEAKDVRATRENWRKALHEWETSPDNKSSLSVLRRNFRNDSAERSKEQQGGSEVLRSLHSGHVPSNDKHENMGHLARSKMESKRQDRQKLRWSRDNFRSFLGGFREFLQGHVLNILGRFNDRKNRQQSTIFERQLSVGNEYGTTVEQAKQSLSGLSGREGSFGRIGKEVRVQQNDVDDETEPRNDRGRSSDGLHGIQLRKAHVFDLVDCGPRHQFLIRNEEGDMFISHNSMGHGIDGLQKAGNTLVWYGLNWSLDLYEQFNARVRRQGQGKPVMCHRILMKDTLDQAQALALDDKARTQSSLRNAVKTYRLQKRG